MTHVSKTPRTAIKALLLGSMLPLQALANIEGSVEAGVGYLSDDVYFFGNYLDMHRQGLTPFLDFDLTSLPARNSDSTAYMRAEGEHIGLDMLRLQFEAGQQGSQRFRFLYLTLPAYESDDARSPLYFSGPANLSLPLNWQAADASTAGLTTLEENLRELSLGQRRHSLRLDYRRHLNPEWTLHADFRRERIQGTRALGGVTGATGGNVRAALLPAPVDLETRIASFAVAYAEGPLHWRLSYHGSFFDNGQHSLSWPTLYAAHPQWAAGTGFPDGMNQMAREPDNQAHQLRLNGSLQMSPRNRLHLDAMLGRQRQNQSLLPYSINSWLQTEAELPRDSLNARVHNSQFNLRLNSRPVQQLNLVSRLSWRERDNRTPIEAWQRVRGDAVFQQAFADARLNRPYSLRETRFTSDANWRLSGSMRLTGGYAWSNTERNYSEISRAEEHGISVGIRSTRFRTAALAADYQFQRRRTDEYIGNRPYIETHVPGTIDAEDFENHPLLRKYYLSERDRQQWRLHGNWYPHARVTFGAALAYNHDNYPAGYFGLNKSTMLSTTFDATYTTDEDLRISAFINRDRYRNEQSGRSFRGSVPADASDPNRNWWITARDRYHVVGISMDREELRPRLGNWRPAGTLNLEAEISHSRSRGDIDPVAGAGLQAAPLPELGTRFNSLERSARYHFSARNSLQLGIEHERYSSTDFAYDNVAPDTLSSVLLMGQASPHYQVTWTTLSYRHQF